MTDEAERTLRGPALARKTGRTNRTPAGARRRTIIVSVLKSPRNHLASFTRNRSQVGDWLIFPASFRAGAKSPGTSGRPIAGKNVPVPLAEV
jgi:hypothetical protein